MTDVHAAVETVDGPPDYFDVLVAALRELLVAKGLIGADEVRAMVETLDAHGPTIGAGLVARAWVDPDFKARLLDDATAVVEQSGIDNYDDTRFIVLEQTPQVHNLSSARCAPATRARCWACRPTGTRAGPTGRARCASRGRCWRSSGPACRRTCGSGCTTAPRTCGTWSCRCDRPGPTTGPSSSWPTWSRATP